MKTTVTLILVGSFVAGACYVSIWNPANWGMTSSSKFSHAAFMSITPGDPIEEVVENLGQPVATGQWSDCGDGPCTNFVFATEPTDWWVFGYYKAWVLVSADGKVIRTIRYFEP